MSAELLLTTGYIPTLNRVREIIDECMDARVVGETAGGRPIIEISGATEAATAILGLLGEKCPDCTEGWTEHCPAKVCETCKGLGLKSEKAPSTNAEGQVER